MNEVRFDPAEPIGRVDIDGKRARHATRRLPPPRLRIEWSGPSAHSAAARNRTVSRWSAPSDSQAWSRKATRSVACTFTVDIYAPDGLGGIEPHLVHCELGLVPYRSGYNGKVILRAPRDADFEWEMDSS